MRGRKILLVEDNSSDEALIKRVFSKANVKNEIVTVRDGEEVLEYLFCKGAYHGRNGDDVPRVVFLDLKLPKVDGLEVLKQIKANEKTSLVPVVILTSSREEGDVVEGFKRGANSYVVKPVDAADFNDCIQQLALYWMNLNEPCPLNFWGTEK